MILYVTSFNKEFYEATGKQLIKSFIDSNTRTESCLFAAYEGNCDIVKDYSVIPYNLDVDVNLVNWLINNRQHIPKEFGGEAPPCTCMPSDISSDKCHKLGCAHSIWNRRASGWARKTFAMMAAMVRYDIDYIIWVDSDSVFIDKMTKNALDNIFGGYDAVYHYGPYRKKLYGSAETGLMGFTKEGQTIVASVYYKYVSQEYLAERRWDDSHLYTQQFEQFPNCKDLISDNIRSSHVVQYSPMGRYIVHNKNFHHRNQIV